MRKNWQGKKQRLLAILLSAVLALNSVTLTAFAEDTQVPDDGSGTSASEQINTEGDGAPDDGIGADGLIPPSFIHPEGATLNEDGTYTYPDGTIHNADGSLVEVIPEPEFTVDENGNTIYKDGTIVYANGMTKYPDGTILHAEDATLNEDGTYTYPDGTVYNADGTLVEVTPEPEFTVDENGNTIYNDGTIVYANGMTKYPDGTILHAEDATLNEDGTYTYPDGTVYNADGTLVEVTPEPEFTVDENGNTIYKDGTIVYANGMTKYPDGTVLHAEDAILNENGTYTYPDGTVYNADGTLFVAKKKPANRLQIALGTSNARATGETTYVLAGSDFQARGGDDAGTKIVNSIITKIKNDLSNPTISGFLFAGDYSVNATKSTNVKNFENTIKTAFPELTDKTLVLIQGNHDNSNEYGGAEAGMVGSVIDISGNHDTDNYGVFVINEKDYMWRNNDEATIKKTAENLEAYLNAKRNAGYTKPIFVISHLPLHYCMRTRNDGDGMYANYIFDVLNEAGNAGLNIIFMFGHNHSHGWDDYLGGAAIFLTKNDKINIAQGSKITFVEETLAFTYMNAGYVGYYGDSYTSSVDKTLTMTTFAITDTDVTISRYDSNGTHDLKSAGVYNVEYPDSAYYSTDTTTVGTPYTLTLNTEITPAGEEVGAPDSGNTTTERTYTRVTSTSELVSGGKYLIFYNGSHFMLPEVVEKSDGSVRKGFNIERTSVCGPDTIAGDYTAKEWTLTSSGSDWLLGNGTQYAKLTNTSDYSVTATLENSGDAFTIGGSENAFTFSNGTYVLNYNKRGLINGYASNPASFYIYRMTNEGSNSSVDITGGDWVTITKPADGTTTYTYTQATSITAGEEYVIVGNRNAVALMDNNGSMGSQTVTINGSTMTSTVELTEWTFSGTSSGTIYNGTRYLYYDDSFELNEDSTNLTFTDNDSNFRIWRDGKSDYSFYYNGSTWTRSKKNVSQYVRLYQLTDTTTTGGTSGLYGKISGELIYNVANGTSAEDALAAVKAGIDILYHNGDESAAETFPDDGDGMTWTLDPSYNGNTGGEYAVTIAYNGVTLGVAKVVVPSVNITGYSVEPAEGTVTKGASQAAQTDALIYVQLENGKYYTVPVTVAMLTKEDGSAVSTGETGTFENLTLTYNGAKITENFTLNVVAKAGNNYPEYPNEGAVKVSKTATGIDFQASGIAQVEVSASGVPLKKGADVIVMLDLSSSMINTVDGKTRLSVLENSLKSMMTQLKANGSDGQPMDIRIAVADFHRYYTDSSSPYYINSADHLINGSIRTNIDGTNQVYTGSGALNAGAFVSVHDLAVNEFSGLSTKSGTNYDYALDAVYQLGEAITTKNAADGAERDLFVIFMSDGAPFQFNYFSAQSGSSSSTTDARYWNNWLQGTMTDAMFDANARNDYYNEDGKHWMAEAIKGDPASTYPVIRKNNAADTDGDTWVNVNGLGAKMYSIGFCLAVDKEITVTSMDTVIRNIASSEQYYFRANTADDLNNAFTSISGDIAYAAYNARFVDQMGDDFNLQMKPSTYKVVVDGTQVEKTLAPVIEILTYDIYTKAEADAGQIPTGKNIGDRKGTSTLKEVVKFSDDGTKAYSNLIDKDKDGIYGVTVNADGTYTISDTNDNILDDGVISAATFWYNTNTTAVAIDGASIPTGKDSANLTTGSTNKLPSETFYWKMGTVQTSELAMRYYVYLEGSMEGTRDAGSYPTNEFATLYYDNYLHNPCYKDTVSPTVAWKEANVSYAFYLVNEDGEIIVNQTTGETGSFANKIAVTTPVVHDTILLNNLDQVRSIDVISSGVLPDYYTLYDSTKNNGTTVGATYTITIHSNTTGSWEITSYKDVATTYVTGFDPDDASAYSKEKVVNDEDTITGYDFTHTTVWFAVVFNRQAYPDSVVIDYGLPVDISVLDNDMFGENGKLAGIGPLSALPNNYDDEGVFTGTMNNGFDDVYEDPQNGFGKATVLRDDQGNSLGKVRYQLNKSNGMQMNTYEKFAYAVHYTDSTNPGYYYDTITVIPATTIYYEDNFLTFTGSNNSTSTEDIVVEIPESGMVPGQWYLEGTTKTDATQSEDRPGKYSLTDANNIYGYDGVNLSMSTYSLGSAAKIKVDANSFGRATFTFYGTGFDVISMTSNTTGTMLVKVVNEEEVTTADGTTYAAGTYKKTPVIDTYYGYKTELYKVTYTYTNGTWVRTVGEKAADGEVERIVDTTSVGTVGETKDGIEYVWVLDPNTEKALYQIPVIQIEDLPYGKYTVTLTATYATSFDHTTEDGYYLYLDAIRIYDPANDGAADGSTDTTIEDAYKADGEGWPSYIELRNKLIDPDNDIATEDGSLGNDDTSTHVEGLVFIDGDASVGDAQISDYISYGPNNEVYLTPDQRVAFIVSKPVNSANVHIGLKSADGKPASYTITNIAISDRTVDNVTITAGTYYNAKTYTVDTTTDMYYDLTPWANGDIVVISNYTEDTQTKGILSITNIKSTYKSNPMKINAPRFTSIYMTRPAAELTIDTLNNMDSSVAPDSGNNGTQPDSGNNNSEKDSPKDDYNDNNNVDDSDEDFSGSIESKDEPTEGTESKDDTTEDTKSKDDTTEDTESKDDTTKDTESKDDTTEDTESKDDTTEDTESKDDTTEDTESKDDTTEDTESKDEVANENTSILSKIIKAILNFFSGIGNWFKGLFSRKV